MVTTRVESSSASLPAASANRVAYNAAVGLGFFAIAYAQVFVFPALARSPGADSTVFLAGAARMARGEAIYRDFFELTYPGTELYYAAWMKLFGVRAWIQAVTLTALGAACGFLTWRIARYSVRSEKAALLAGLATLAFPFYIANDATHRWFSTTLALAAVLVALREKRRSSLLAGALCGVAAFFTQTTGLLMILALCGWIVWRSGAEQRRGAAREAAVAFAAFAVVLVLLCAYFVAQAGPRVFWYSTVTFVLTNYGSVWWNSWTTYMHALPGRSLNRFPEQAAWLLVYGTVPLAYVVFVVRYWRRRDKNDERWKALMLVELTGVAMFLSVAKAASVQRMAMGSMPAIILAVWMLYEPGAAELALRKMLWVATVLALAVGPAQRQLQWHGTLDTPVGRVAFPSRDQFETVRWLETRTRPGELCFGHPPLEFLLGLKSAGYIPFANGGEYTPPAQVEDLMRRLERQKVPLILTSAMAYMPQPNSPDYLLPYRSYLLQNYRLVKVFGGATEVWVRKGVEFPQ